MQGMWFAAVLSLLSKAVKKIIRVFLLTAADHFIVLLSAGYTSNKYKMVQKVYGVIPEAGELWFFYLAIYYGDSVLTLSF